MTFEEMIDKFIEGFDDVLGGELAFEFGVKLCDLR